MEEPANFRKILTGATISYSTSTSTATTGPVSAPATRRDGRGSSPVSCMSLRPSRPSRFLKAARWHMRRQPRRCRVAHWPTLATAPVGELLPMESEPHGASLLSLALPDQHPRVADGIALHPRPAGHTG